MSLRNRHGHMGGHFEDTNRTRRHAFGRLTQPSMEVAQESAAALYRRVDAAAGRADGIPTTLVWSLDPAPGPQIILQAEYAMKGVAERVKSNDTQGFRPRRLRFRFKGLCVTFHLSGRVSCPIGPGGDIRGPAEVTRELVSTVWPHASLVPVEAAPGMENNAPVVPTTPRVCPQRLLSAKVAHGVGDLTDVSRPVLRTLVIASSALGVPDIGLAALYELARRGQPDEPIPGWAARDTLKFITGQPGNSSIPLPQGGCSGQAVYEFVDRGGLVPAWLLQCFIIAASKRLVDGVAFVGVPRSMCVPGVDRWSSEGAWWGRQRSRLATRILSGLWSDPIARWLKGIRDAIPHGYESVRCAWGRPCAPGGPLRVCDFLSLFSTDGSPCNAPPGWTPHLHMSVLYQAITTLR